MIVGIKRQDFIQWGEEKEKRERERERESDSCSANY